MGEFLSRIAPPTIAFAGLLVAWELACVFFAIPPFMLPRPTAVATAFWEFRAELPAHTLFTLQSTVLGFIVSVLVALPLAAVIVAVPIIERAVNPLLVLSQAVPKVAVAPIIVLAVGMGLGSKVLICFLIAFFPIIVNSVAGLSLTPPELLDLSRSYRASAIKTFWKVRFPMAMPFIFSGMKMAITFAVTGAVVGEFVGADRGLGYLVMSATAYWRADLAFASMLILALLAIVLYAAIEYAEKLLCPWYAEERSQ